MTHHNKMIPYEDLMIGSGIALNNAKKFSDGMNKLYDAKFYESGTILGTYALEEYGKYRFLLKKFNEQKSISYDDDIFQSHRTKINAIINYFKDTANEKDIEDMRKYLKKLIDIRFQLLYSNWNSVSKKWFKNTIIDDEWALILKYLVQKFILDHIVSFGGNPNLSTLSPKRLMQLLSNEKIYIKCEKCLQCIRTHDERRRGCKCDDQSYWKTFDAIQ